jgi:hypothetical protein
VTPPPTLPMSGTVIDLMGRPVADLDVTLTRHSFRPPDHEGFQSVAYAKTDSQGKFSFGDVAVNTEIAFPLETGAVFEYEVRKDRAQRLIDNIKFTAPRTDSVVTSVSAEIYVR